MICQSVIFKKAKKDGEDFEQVGNEGNADLNVHARLHAVYLAYIWKKQIRTRICRENEGKMNEKKPAIIKFFYGRPQKVSKTVKKSSKKVLTGERDCDIIIELSARATKPSGQRMILENDTESRRTRTAIFTSRS